jgi:hypothetical protein
LGLVAVASESRAADQIFLQGVVSAQCTIVVTATPAAMSLPLTTSGAQRILVGSVVQNCNKKTGFTLRAASANCAAVPVGAKVLDTVSTEFVPYSVEFDNPTTGASLAAVTGLLANSCTPALAREVTNAKSVNESSSVYVNFTGAPLLAAGTYLDTLTITMNVK